MAELNTLYLPEKYAVQVRKLLEKYIPEATVWAYGSRVRGDHYEASDLDLVARFPAEKKRDVFRLGVVREAFVESHVPIIVQIVDWDEIPESFKQEILAGYVVIQKTDVEPTA